MSASLAAVKASATLFLADPVNGGPAALPGDAGGKVNVLWSYGGMILAIVASIAMLGAFIVAMVNHQQGRPNEGFGKVFVILGCCILGGSIGTVVGQMTGT